MKKAVNSNNTTTINTGTLSTVPYQAAMQYGREPTISSSNAPLLASFFASLLAFFLAFASPPGYIHFAKDMEAIGQGQVYGHIGKAQDMSLRREHSQQRGRYLFLFSVAFITDSSISVSIGPSALACDLLLSSIDYLYLYIIYIFYTTHNITFIYSTHYRISP